MLEAADQPVPELQRARNVFDPVCETTSWTYPTPNGGYWFEYFNKPRGSRQWVINTHATSLGNAGRFALLARDLGRMDDFLYWRDIFERGIDGMIWAWEQPDMWADYDLNEVLYARPPETGPQDYHHWMISAWTPNVIRLTMDMDRDYRLTDLVHYWERMARANITTDDDRGYMEPLLSHVKARLAKTE